MQLHTIQHRRTLAVYLALCAQHASWQRKFVALAASSDAQPVAFAALAAGAAVLWITADAQELRRANQASLTDFNVDSLSESLRILKNEIRKGLPVSVGLLGSPSDLFEQMVIRGVQPDALFSFAPVRAEMLLARGAVLLSSDVSCAGIEVDEAVHWRTRQSQDAALLHRVNALDSAQAQLAQRWLNASARLFPRDLHRAYHADWLCHERKTR